MRRLIASLLFFVAGCTLAATHRLDDLYGPPDPARFENAPASEVSRAKWENVSNVLEHRCVVCHACYDAPCQLKLSSYDGVTRGASKDIVYATRLVEASPTRLHLDAETNAEWRAKGFHPVLNERKDTAEANARASVMHRILELRRRQPQAAPAILPADKYDFSLSRAPVCATIDEIGEVEKRPELGMPFGMPGLSTAEYGALTDWIEAGSPYAPPAPLDAAHGARIAAWEQFLNGDSLKERLMSRYIYEHWYLGHFYFDDLRAAPATGAAVEYFELVRSSTPPGQPIRVIATRRPYDDPGVERPYYRLRRMDEAIVAKTHMPYPLDSARLKHLKSLFLDADYTVTSMPSYAPEIASNPFRAFVEIPSIARYRLMLEQAQFTIMGFIKGPVCRGQVAPNVINDLFWVAFVDPDKMQQGELGEGELAAALDQIQLPAEAGSMLPLLQWKSYANAETRYLEAKTDVLNRRFGGKLAPTLDLLWDGDGKNRNAALTIFRHFDSATVVQGFVGEPQTMWVVGYPLLERIHYLLVAGYDVFGNVGHQLTTRLYMDFLRMEGESNFLYLLPMASRDPVRDFWYRGASDDVKQYLQGDKAFFAHETGVVYRTDEPLTELYGMMKSKLSPVLDRRYDIRASRLSRDVAGSMARLGQLSGVATSYLPEVTFVTLTGPDGAAEHYSLLHNSAHNNISTLFREAAERLPAEDTVTVVSGFLGAYPNAFQNMPASEFPAYVEAISKLSSEADYSATMAKYGVRRTDPRFWAHSDALHAAYRKMAPIEAGIFDYGRYENR
ncbi:MAG TPA: fatty acid cis/trans isomerase [Candidatus Limnocylindrales bacterium]|nr:fatty acid cis/trans isomerase [Candidatus Limnocylindrales bacterium]